MRVIRRHPAALFLLSALMVLGASVAILRSRAFAANADVAAWGITFDLTISIPLLYWFFIVRTGRAPLVTVVPLFVIGTLAASWLLPGAQQQFAKQLGTFVVPLAEVLLVVALVRGGAFRRDSLFMQVLASEAAILSYAFSGWTKKPEPREHAVTFHERNGWGTIVACICVLIAAEGIAIHLFLARTSTLMAWGWSALDFWAVLWLLGDYHALRLRRSWIDGDALHIRYGMRWSVTIPRELIASVEEIRHEHQWKRKDVLRIAILEEPRWLITLREPLVARGLAGMRKEIRALALLPDQDEWMANFELRAS
jgi:hypothetical protein